MTRRVGGQAPSTGRLSHRPCRNEHPKHRVARPSPQPGPLREQWPRVDPICLNSALPRRAGRASASYRLFGRDRWPQGQLQGWYAAEPAEDAPPLSPSAGSDLGDCRRPLLHPHDSERLGPRPTDARIGRGGAASGWAPATSCDARFRARSDRGPGRAAGALAALPLVVYRSLKNAVPRWRTTSARAWRGRWR